MILLPLGNNSLNISNANVIADFDDVDRKQVNVSSLKCNNININVNGLELYVPSTISQRMINSYSNKWGNYSAEKFNK